MIDFDDKFRFILLALCMLLLGVALAVWWSNRGTDVSSEPRIDSFASLQWGADSSTIFNRYGSSQQSHVEVNEYFEKAATPGKEIKYFNASLFGEEGNLRFIVHPRDGLVKGIFEAEFGRWIDCKRVYGKIAHELNKNYDSLLVRRNHYNKLNVNFCNSVLVGKAAKYAYWRDSSNNHISLVVGSEVSKRRVTVIYESAKFYRWKSRVETAGQTWFHYFLPFGF